MDVWQLILYGVASILALKSLLVLMEYHKRRYTQQLLSERQDGQQQADDETPQETGDRTVADSSDSAA